MKKNRAKQNKRRTIIGLSFLAAFFFQNRTARAQSVSCFQNLYFGSIMPATGAGTQTVAQDGSYTPTGGISVLDTPWQGRCLLTGSLFPVRPMVVSITAPSYNIVNGANNMLVDNFDLHPTGTGRTATITAFITTIEIGARLSIAGNQAAGTYTGSFTVNVNFQ